MFNLQGMSISVIGIGRLGGALALALSEKGFEVENLFARNNKNPDKIAGLTNSKILTDDDFGKIHSEIILITTQDSEISYVAESLAGKLKSKPIVLHTSGSLSSVILNNLKNIDCPVGSLHPLVSISDSFLGKARFQNAFFCVEGDNEAVEAAKNIVSKLGGKSFSIETKYKPLYHASAVTACGHLVAVIDTAIEMLSECGLSETESKEIFLPLIESTVENLKYQTPAESLTGTFSRADAETFDRHLEIMEKKVSDEALEIYLLLGERSLKLAEKQGADKKRLQTMREKISLAKKKPEMLK
ncbi:MAG: Rossmann-like and DUF2520 domain-containing protein [Pyrinomonadaceae bacterium]